MEDNEVFIPYIQIRPLDILFFTRYVGPRKKQIDWDSINEDNRPEQFKEKPQRNSMDYTGTFTSSARKRMLCALDCLILCCPARNIFNPISKSWHNFQMSFITLTYSCTQIVDYSESIKHLEKFLKWLLRTADGKLYVWRLELQKRGQIHYHIVTDCFIRWNLVRDKWNSIQRKAGLIQRGMDYNSTDIKSAISISDVSSYCAKYMTKSDTNATNYTGSQIKKYWGCSQNLQGVKRPTFDLSQVRGSVSELQEIVYYEPFRSFNPSDYCTYIAGPRGSAFGSASRLAINLLQLDNELEVWKSEILDKN